MVLPRPVKILYGPISYGGHTSFTQSQKRKRLTTWLHLPLCIHISFNLIVTKNGRLRGTIYSTTPCTRPRVFLLAFLETNPCPTLYPTLCFWKQLRGRGILRSQALPAREQTMAVLQATESWAGPGNKARKSSALTTFRPGGNSLVNCLYRFVSKSPWSHVSWIVNSKTLK